MNKMMLQLMRVIWHLYRNWHLTFSNKKCMRVTFSHGIDVPGWVYVIDNGTQIMNVGNGWYKVI